MSSQGTLLARVYTSNAMLPVKGAAVTVTRRGRTQKPELLALRLTNVDGVTEAISIPTPDQRGVTPQETGQPFTLVDIAVHQTGYDRILVEDVPVFSGVQTVQELMLVPTPRLPQQYDRTETVVVTEPEL